MTKTRSEKDKRYEERHKEERKAKNAIWGTSLPRSTAEEIDAFLKRNGYTKVKLIEEGYKALLEQADEIDTDLAKIMDGYDDFFDFELRKIKEERKNVTKLKNEEEDFVYMERVHSIHPEREHSIRTIER